MFKNLRSVIAVSLINLTFMSSLTAFADSSVTPAITPEAILVSQAIAIGAKGLSKDQAEQAIKDAFAKYSASPSSDHQMENLRTALVDMNVYSAAQADEFVLEAQVAGTPLLAQNNALPEVQSSAIIEALGTIQAPQGAQFSTCPSRAKTIEFYVAAAIWLPTSVYAMADRSLTLHQQDAIIIGGFAAFAASVVLMDAFDHRKC